MVNTQKDTIYIDIDDEITTIIEKLQTSPQRIVALVLPKRASVLQSIVNMKLLKRSADNTKKQIVLITSEAGLLPLAGAVGMHVASSLQSKPAIPAAPDAINREHVIDEDTGEEFDDFNSDVASAVPVGTLAGVGLAPSVTGAVGAAGLGAAASARNEPETIEMDNDEPAEADKSSDVATGASTVPKKGKNKKLKVPNFNRFRLAIGLLVLMLVLVGGGFIYANMALTRATITIKTNSMDIATKINLTLDPEAKQIEPASQTVPAKVVSKQQTGSQQVSTSGQKNNGTRAAGTVTMTAQYCNASLATVTTPNDVPSGTGVSSNGKTFISQQRTAFPDNGNFKNGCVTYVATASTSVSAQVAGADSNAAAATFTVAGRSEISAKSTDAFSGGTDNIVKTVTQADIDSAKAKIASNDNGTIKDDLTKNLQASGYNAILATLHAGDAVITPSAAVGDQADTVTVTSATNYIMYGIKLTDIKQIITNNVMKQIDPSKQQILRDGADKAVYKVDAPVLSGPLPVLLTASSLAGPDIKLDVLKSQLAGKKSGDIASIVRAIPGVTDVSSKFSPFWVSAVPANPDKVSIIIQKTGN